MMSMQLQEIWLSDAAQPAIWGVVTIMACMAVAHGPRPDAGNPLLSPLLASITAMVGAMMLGGSHAGDVQITDVMHDLTAAFLGLRFISRFPSDPRAGP